LVTLKPFHGEQLPVDGVMRLIQQGARHWHLQVCEHRIPACLLVPHPVPYAVAVGHSSCHGHVVRKAPQSLAERKHPQALALSRPVPQDVKLQA